MHPCSSVLCDPLLQLLHISSTVGGQMLFSVAKALNHCVAPSSSVAFAVPTYRVESWENEALGPMTRSRVGYSFLRWHTARD